MNILHNIQYIWCNFSKKWGWIYRPVSLQGFTVSLLALIFCVQVFVAADRNSHSVSDTLYGIYPFIVPTLMLLYWVATKTSEPDA